MLKKSFTRLARIASSTFGTAKEDGFSLETSLTKFERFVHFWVLVWRSFVRNRCPVRASALSYTTLIALIPMLAVIMSITNVLVKTGGEERIKQFIEQFVDNLIPTASVLDARLGDAKSGEPGIPTEGTNASDFTAEAQALTQEFSNKLARLQFDTNTFLLATLNSNAPPAGTNQTELSTVAGVAKVKQSVSREAANMIYQFAEKSYNSALGVTGMIFLVLTAILTLTRVEETFNDIWGVTRGREWWSRITNYFFTIALGPTLIVVALGLANGPRFQQIKELITVVPFIEPLLSTYLPLIIICFTFALFYKLVPNTKVNFSAALIGGSLAGIMWHFYKQLGVLMASSALNANAVYGRLFIVPLLMGGLYVAWLTVLFGSQVAYAFQNRASYLQDRLAENVNQRGREFVALRLMTCIGQRFHRGLPPATVREISAELGIPSRLVQQVLRTLLLAGLVVEVSGVESGYSPARPLDAINCHHILLAMRATQGQEPATRDEPVRAEVLGEFARIQAAEKEAASSVTMLALVNRAQARLGLAAPVVLQKEMASKSIDGPTAAPIILSTEQEIAEPTIVEFVESTKADQPAAKPRADGVADRSAVDTGTPKTTDSKSSPSIKSAVVTATATHENESFPL